MAKNTTPTPEDLLIENRIKEHVKPMPFYVQEYIQAKDSKMTNNTLLQYLYRFQHFFEWTLSEGIVEAENIASIPLEALEKLKKSDVQYYIEFLQKEDISKENEIGVRRRNSAVVDLSIHALKSLFKYLTTETETSDGECYFYRNVMAKIESVSKKESASNRARQISTVILNDEDIREYLHFIEFEYVQTLKTPHQLRSYERNILRDLAINAIILGTGMRVGEVARLEVKNVNIRKRMVSVLRKGEKPDTLLVMQSAMEILERYMRQRTVKYPKAAKYPFLFVTNYRQSVTALSRRAIQNIVNKYTAAFFLSKRVNQNEDDFLNVYTDDDEEKARKNLEEGISPHKLRHSFAADFIRNGGNIILLRDQLGHNNIQTTSLYTNLSDADSFKVLDEMDKQRKQPGSVSEEENN